LKKSSDTFTIIHIDPLGQGVSRKEEEVFFIHNTLPGEEGLAEIDGQKKGVMFGHLSSPDKLTTISEKRISPDCPHFFECNGCHFLHTTYENEIFIKKSNLERSISFYERKTGNILKRDRVFIHSSSDRFNTRNRIQLHYDLSKKRLGLIGHKKNQIIEVPNCLIGTREIQHEVKKLYFENHWISLVPKGSPKQGHIEIIKSVADEVDIVFNHPYSHGGFTQVNRKMNDVLCSIVHEKSLEIFSKSDVIFDLFGGSGNLSKKLTNKKCLVYDSYGEGMLVEKDGHQEFIRQNLYSSNAPNIIASKIKEFERAGIIIDPPRSGLKNIQEFLPKKTNLNQIIYVSCNPATLFRDLINIPYFKLTEIHLVDLFPSTYHYETVAILER